MLELSYVIAMVVFPLAAASTPELVRRRAVRTLRIASLALPPIVPAVIVFAPVAIPAVFGREWHGAVLPFQLLLVVAVAHAVLNTFGESLAGVGHIAFRARVNLVWMVAMAVALVCLVPVWGITGAAVAHLVLISA